MTDIHPTAIVADGAELGEGVGIGPYSIVGPQVKLGDGCMLKAHAVVEGKTTLGPECQIFSFACIGGATQDLKYDGGDTFVEVGARTVMREYVTINAGTRDGEVTRVGDGTLLLAYCHVAHGCVVGNEVIMSNGVNLAGEVIVEDKAVIGGMTGVHQFCRVGTMSMVGAMSLLTQDCPPYMLCSGNPALARSPNIIGLRRRDVPAEIRSQLKQAYKILFREGLTVANATARIRENLQPCAEIERLIAFARNTSRGLIGSE